MQTALKVTEVLLRHPDMERRELTKRVYEFSTLCVINRIQSEILQLARRLALEDNVACIVPADSHALATCLLLTLAV